MINKLPAFLTVSFGLVFIASDLEHFGCHTCRHLLPVLIFISLNSSIGVLVIEEYEACGA